MHLRLIDSIAQTSSLDFDSPGITNEEKRKRKKMNTVTTGINLAVWILEIVAWVIILLPMVF